MGQRQAQKEHDIRSFKRLNVILFCRSATAGAGVSHPRKRVVIMKVMNVAGENECANRR